MQQSFQMLCILIAADLPVWFLNVQVQCRFKQTSCLPAVELVAQRTCATADAEYDISGMCYVDAPTLMHKASA
jgi:hypothetical protein